MTFYLHVAIQRHRERENPERDNSLSHLVVLILGCLSVTLEGAECVLEGSPSATSVSLSWVFSAVPVSPAI